MLGARTEPSRGAAGDVAAHTKGRPGSPIPCLTSRTHRQFFPGTGFESAGCRYSADGLVWTRLGTDTVCGNTGRRHWTYHLLHNCKGTLNRDAALEQHERQLLTSVLFPR